MYFYYFWNERLTPAGHALFIFSIFALFFVWAPGAYSVKALLLFCAALLIIGIFTRWPLKKVDVSSVRVHPVREGEIAKVTAIVTGSKKYPAIKLGSYRMHPALKLLNNTEWDSISTGTAIPLTANVLTSRRGAFPLIHVAAAVPDSMGIATFLKKAEGESELLVLPRTIKVLDFGFLTYGASGRAFAPYLTPSLQRGMDFIGVREYREGDSLRDLHHQSFARYGKPFTKEFAAERGEGLVLLLDVSCKTFFDKSRVENAVRLTAGIAAWLIDRSLLGRFFIGNQEIPLAGHNSLETVLAALARAPYPELHHDFPSPSEWAPAARPMAPVVAVSVLPLESKLVTKQIVVSETDEKTDDKLFVNLNAITVKSALSRVDVNVTETSKMEVTL